MNTPTRIAVMGLIFAGAMVSDLHVQVRHAERINASGILERLTAVAGAVEVEVAFVSPVAASVAEYD